MLPLLAVLLTPDGAAGPSTPAPRPPAAIAAPARLEAPRGGRITTGPVACTQLLGCGTTSTVSTRLDTLDGFSASTSPAWDRGAVSRSPEYSARLDVELCEAKPVFCPLAP